MASDSSEPFTYRVSPYFTNDDKCGCVSLGEHIAVHPTAGRDLWISKRPDAEFCNADPTLLITFGPVHSYHSYAACDVHKENVIKFLGHRIGAHDSINVWARVGDTWTHDPTQSAASTDNAHREMWARRIEDAQARERDCRQSGYLSPADYWQSVHKRATAKLAGLSAP
jgi:hypothetical protein